MPISKSKEQLHAKRQERQAILKAIANECKKHKIQKDLAFKTKLNKKKDLREDINQAIKDKNFIQLKHLLAEQMEAKRGILCEHVVIEPNMDNQLQKPVHVYLRDAREQDLEVAKKNQESYENWAINGLAYFQIARKVMLLHLGNNITPVDIDGLIFARVNKFLDDIRAGCNNGGMSPQNAQNYVYGIIQRHLSVLLSEGLFAEGYKISPAEAISLMEKMKDCTNLEEEPYAQVTLLRSDVGNNTYSKERIAIPIAEMTDSQQQEYEHIKNGHLLPRWYKKQKAEQKNVIQSYAPQIKQGRVLPTQGIKFLFGLRNGYESYEIDHNDTEGTEKISSADRVGHLGHMIGARSWGKYLTSFLNPMTWINPFKWSLVQLFIYDADFNENVRLSKQAIEQYVEATGKTELLLQSTISPIFLVKHDEYYLHRCAQEAVKQFNKENEARAHVTYANTPLNLLRWFYLLNDRSIEDKVIDDAKKLIKTLVSPTIRESVVESTIKDALESQKIDQSFAAGIVNGDKARELLVDVVAYIKIRNTRAGLFTWGTQKNGELMAKIAQINDTINIINDTLGEGRTRPYTQYTISCKSSKDRTGLAFILWSIDVAARFISKQAMSLHKRYKNFSKRKVSNEIQAEEEMAARVIFSGHDQVLAAGQGGSPGAEGLKDSWASRIIPKWLFPVKEVIKKSTAKANKHVKFKEGETPLGKVTRKITEVTPLLPKLPTEGLSTGSKKLSTGSKKKRKGHSASGQRQSGNRNHNRSKVEFGV